MLDRIKELCRGSRLSLSALEKEAGLSSGSICKWDRCNPSAEKVAKVAKILHTTVDYLVNGDAPRGGQR